MGLFWGSILAELYLEAVLRHTKELEEEPVGNRIFPPILFTGILFIFQMKLRMLALWVPKQCPTQ